MLKAASFAMVGVVNTLVDYSVFLSAYYLLKLPLIPANVLAWLTHLRARELTTGTIRTRWR